MGDPESVALEVLPEVARARILVAGTALEAELERRQGRLQRKPVRIDDHPALIGVWGDSEGLGNGF